MKKLFLALAILFSSATIAEAQYPRVVGYQPQIIWLPQGTYFGVGNVYVSPNRRYVRMGINVGFSSIPRVDTFNFVTGQQQIIWNNNGKAQNRN